MAQHRLFKHPDNTYAFVSTDPKWSHLGASAPDSLLTASEAMSLTGMSDMELIEAPLFSRVEAEGSSTSYRMPKNKGILVRDYVHNTTKPVGVTGVARTTTQFSELAYPMDALVEESGGTIETFGLLEPGGRWFCIVRLPDEKVIAGDTYYPYMWGVDGLWSNYVVQPRLMRLSCFNQFPAFLLGAKENRGVGSYVMRHTSRAQVDLKAMRAAVGYTETMVEELDTISKIFLDEEFVTAEFNALTDHLFGALDENPSAAQRTNYRKRNMALQALFAGNGESTETTWRDGHPTKWTAFQAITEYVDWHQPVSGSGRGKDARRFERIMDASVQNIKSTALEALR